MDAQNSETIQIRRKKCPKVFVFTDHEINKYNMQKMQTNFKCPLEYIIIICMLFLIWLLL